jgi:hypothetical protein
LFGNILAENRPDPSHREDGLGVGMSFAGGFIIFGGLGVFIGRKAGSEIFGVMLGLVMAFAFIFYEIWKLSKADGAGNDGSTDDDL